MPPRSERAQELTNYVLDETERYRNGVIDRFSTNRELSERFGYTPGGISSVLSNAGIGGIRRASINERRGTWFSETRGEDLSEFVRDEIDRFRAGEIDRVSSVGSLSQRFGYAPNTGTAVTFHLRKAGIFEERREVMEQIESMAPSPSQEFAWILGILSGGHWKGISTSTRPELADRFKHLGENIFKLNATEFEHTLASKGKIYQMRHISFPPMRIKRLAGDLSRSEWSSTIVDRHEWLFRQQEYIWKFLEGYLEVSGSVDAHSRSINFYTQNMQGANLLIDFLTSVGVQRPKLSFLRADQQDLRGVSIRNLRDIGYIADHIHSVTDDRERKLGVFRGSHLRGLPMIPISVEEVVNEWTRIRQILGRVPTSKDINRLKAEGLTKFSHMVYANRMGSGRFSKGKEVIEEMIQGRNDVEEYEISGKKQPKVYTSEEIIQEWERLIKLLGHSPSSKEIERMKKQGLTRFSASLYIDRFGEGSYVHARQNLEKITADQNNNQQGEKVVQVFPTLSNS